MTHNLVCINRRNLSEFSNVRHLFRKLDQMMDVHAINPEEGFFSCIYEYEDIKKLLVRCIFATSNYELH